MQIAILVKGAGSFLIAGVLFFVLLTGKWGLAAHVSPENLPKVKLTWMSVSSWLIEVKDPESEEDLRILIEGYVNRVKLDISAGRPAVLRKAIIKKILDGLGYTGSNRRIDYLFVNHSHHDHSFDAPTWAKLTGAVIIGSRSTCYQAFAHGITARQCSIVNGGETLPLAQGVNARVIRWHHRIPKKQAKECKESINHCKSRPLELPEIPKLSESEHGLGLVSSDFPNGGGARAFLFTIDNPSRGLPLSWFYYGTGGFQGHFEEDVVVDGMNFGNPKSNLERAMREAKLTVSGVDLYLGNGRGRSWPEEVVPVVNPKFYIPHHWDTANGEKDFLLGMPFTFHEEIGCGLPKFLKDKHPHIVFLPQRQYMDAYELSFDTKRVKRVLNEAVKHALNFKDYQLEPCIRTM